MEYRFTTTEEQDKALAYYAEQKGSTPEELFAYIVSVEMDRLLKGFGDVSKQTLANVYEKAEKVDKDVIDAIVAKVAAAEAVPVTPIEPNP